MSAAAPPIFDTHCHLGQFPDTDASAEHARAAAAGVVRLLVVGIDAATSAQAHSLTHLPGVGWSAGLHPNDALRLAEEWPAIATLARRPGCLAIGETGLDTFRDRCPLPRQEEALLAHLALAQELDLPVVLHCRDAYSRLFAILRRMPPRRGVMHCFAGTLDDARAALDLGLMLSFAGPLTYPKNDSLRQVAAFAPADRILVETDAPFLPPQSHRGKRNEPALIVGTVQTLAQARQLTFDAAAELTFTNACRLFDRAAG